MAALISRAIVFAAFLVTAVVAQFPPKPEGLKTLKSRFHGGIKISYKEPGICETTPGVKSYSGYVHLPANTLTEPHERQDYPINTFFWFFEARKDPHNAPLAIWLNGGPGGSSLIGALSENGPCFVDVDSNSTYINPFSWNNEVNILYIDQPVQVGYSYDYFTNVTVALTADDLDDFQKVTPTDFSDSVPAQNSTFLVGTTGSQNVNFTANSTAHAAVALWHFAQTWFEEFPHYKPHDEKISLFTESYGGRYGPAFVSYFMQQNALIDNGTLRGPGVHYLHMDTLGIVNGCVDEQDTALAWATFANNNTFGIQAFTDAEYHHAMYELKRTGGLLDSIAECRRLQLALDPYDHGDVANVSNYCIAVSQGLDNVTTGIYFRKSLSAPSSRGYGWFDITHPFADPFPPQYAIGYLNQHWVQAALGVPVNHSMIAPAVQGAFSATGDMGRGGSIEHIAYVLDNGVKVAMLYGDRDYACNWVGGESTSLRIPWAGQEAFSEAGYTPLVLSPLHSGGLVRQYGNLSFTRVYQAGHMVPSYQPEAAYEIFMRALTGRDIATGTVEISDELKTEGPPDAWWMKSEVLPAPGGVCYMLSPAMTCTEEEKEWLRDGTAVVKDFVVVGREGEEGVGSVRQAVLAKTGGLRADEQQAMGEL